MAIFKGKKTTVNSRTRTDRRRGIKAINRKGTATWCHARGLKAFGEGASRERRKVKA